MRRNRLLSLVLVAGLMVLSIGCGEDDPAGPTNDDDDDYPPGTQWGGGDWPSLISPTFGQNVTIGADVPTVTALYQENFTPTLTAVRGDHWILKITRPESLCDAWSQWETFGLYWSYALPRFDYHFNFDWICFVSNSTLTNYDVSWPMTETQKFTLMQNGQWVASQALPQISRSEGGNTYRINRSFTLPTQPPLYLSVLRCWVQGSGPDADRTFPEGPITITHRQKSGVKLATTTTFTETVGWSAGINIEGICAGLNQTFETSTSHTASFESEVEITETREYDVPENEQWRYIQLYGVERYCFTDAAGATWTSPYLIPKNLGTIDNAVRNVLMVVKYRGASKAPYSSEFIETGVAAD
jgi:hypothetical protein